MIYKPANGSRLSQVQAQQYGEHIEILLEGNDGIVTPEHLLADAQEITSPLHDFFEWANDVAAHEWRLRQARYLLRSIHVIIKREDGQEEEARALYNVHVSPPDSEASFSVYVAIQRIIDESDLRQQIIEKALRSLMTWQKRYRQYKEFASVFAAIEGVEESLNDKIVE